MLGDGTKEEGEMSPKNLLTTTITDELRKEPTLKESHWYEFKDRGAIYQPAFCKLAFWYSKTGSFISSFYGAVTGLGAKIQ
jgi:hypothetical protein